MARIPKTGQLDAMYTVKKMGMDANGNHSVWVSFRDGRAKKIQTLQNLPLTHRDRALTPRVVDEITDYVHGIGAERFPNPATRKGAARPRRVSQATKRPPTKRLVERRQANVKKGYYPNPTVERITHCVLQLHGGNEEVVCFTRRADYAGIIAKVLQEKARPGVKYVATEA